MWLCVRPDEAGASPSWYLSLAFSSTLSACCGGGCCFAFMDEFCREFRSRFPLFSALALGGSVLTWYAVLSDFVGWCSFPTHLLK